MQPLMPIALAATLVVGATPAAPPPDIPGSWLDRTVALGYRAGIGPTVNARCVAIVALAMFDALNAIEPRFRAYRQQTRPAAGAAGDVAAAAAAHYILLRAYPDYARELDSAFQATLGAVPDGAPKAEGVRLGHDVAARLWTERAADGADAPNTYRPATTAGAYTPTVLPFAPSWGSVKPFALQSGSQFRPGPPPALTSTEWAADYEEVKRLGAKVGSARTAEQTAIARFWEYTGPGTYMPVARQVADAKRLSPLERARVYALVALTAADALVAVFDAKYTFNFWRPVTAIRNGDQDGNDATARDAGWEPLISTPLHPEYPCAHCISQTAVASVLAALFGDTVPELALTSPTAPGVTRRYRRLSDYAAEVLEARIYDGVHYRYSGNVGAAMGRQIAAYVVGNVLTPLR
jgi:hypothetical protein